MIDWIKNLFQEEEPGPSIGSLAFILIVLMYCFDYGWSIIKVQPLRVSPTDVAILAVSLYAVKKAAPAFEGLKDFLEKKKNDDKPQS